VELTKEMFWSAQILADYRNCFWEVTYELHLDGVRVKKRLLMSIVVGSSKEQKVSVCAWSPRYAKAKRICHT